MGEKKKTEAELKQQLETTIAELLALLGADRVYAILQREIYEIRKAEMALRKQNEEKPA